MTSPTKPPPAYSRPDRAHERAHQKSFPALLILYLLARPGVVTTGGARPIGTIATSSRSRCSGSSIRRSARLVFSPKRNSRSEAFPSSAFCRRPRRIDSPLDLGGGSRSNQGLRAPLSSACRRFRTAGGFFAARDLRRPAAEPIPDTGGWGYSQVYYKLRSNGRIGKFPSAWAIAHCGSQGNWRYL